MWVATLLAVVGLLGVAVTTQFTGYRLGGTITVPVLAVYTLKNALMLPVFVISTIAAYVGLWYLRQRTLIYGRDELLAAFVIGIVIESGSNPEVRSFYSYLITALFCVPNLQLRNVFYQFRDLHSI